MNIELKKYKHNLILHLTFKQKSSSKNEITHLSFRVQNYIDIGYKKTNKSDKTQL